MSRLANVNLKQPDEEHASRLFRLLGEVGTLERNSCYTYLLLCTHFRDTCLVAERSGELIGFVLGYRPPSAPESLFVWQVGVTREMRGSGLGAKLLNKLCQQPACRDAQFLTATVSPQNTASLSLFRAFARRRNLSCEIQPGFSATSFADEHPDEPLLRVGPLKGNA